MSDGRSTPSRDSLYKIFASKNQQANHWACLELIGIGALWVFLPKSVLKDEPAWLCLITAYAFGTPLLSLGQIVFLKKHKISSGGTTRIGHYHERDLVQMVEGVRRRIGLPEAEIKVFITRDKDLNAMAIKIGASKRLPWLNGVYINRSLLHLLKPNELRAVIGHEFGHLSEFRSRCHDYLVIHALFSASVGAAVLYLTSVQFGFGEFLSGLTSLAAISGAFAYTSSQRSGQVDEYLCDEYAMSIAGVGPTISALFKIGAASELQLVLQVKAMEAAKAGGKLDPKQALEIYEEVLPFGCPDLETVSIELEKAIGEKQRASGTITLKGFLDYINDDDIDEEAEEAFSQSVTALMDAPKIESRDLRENSKDRPLTISEIKTLVDRLEQDSSSLLFSSRGEMHDKNSTHPATWRRILYLWRNREAIEAGIGLNGSHYI